MQRDIYSKIIAQIKSIAEKINGIGEQVEQKTGTLVFDSSKFTDSDTDSSFVKKDGNIVTLFINGTTSAQIDEWADMGITIPEGFRTASTVFGLGTVSRNAHDFNIRTNGVVLNDTPNDIDSGAKVHLLVTYVV